MLPFDCEDTDLINDKTVRGEYDINEPIFNDISNEAKDLI